MSGPAIYTVRNGLPTLVISPRTDAVTVYNQSPISVYLSSEPGNTGFELPPGSTLTWDAGQYLYAFHKVDGTTADITVLPNAGVMNDTRALARAIVAEGLAPAIATEINALGVPSIDKPETLSTGTPTLISAATRTIVPRMDVSKYASVIGRLNLSYLRGSGSLTSSYRIRVTQYVGALVVAEREYLVQLGSARMQFPVLGTELMVSLISPASSVNSIQHEYSFVATYRELRESIAVDGSETWEQMTGSTQGVIATGQTYKRDVILSGSTNVYYPSWCSGAYDFTWGFYGSSEAAKNTTGLTVIFGPAQATGAHAGYGLVGDPNYTSNNPNTLRQFNGVSSWARPVLTVINRNAQDITLSFSFAYEV